jgi:GPH family glycoside/pentoside/hexuronide:cation symporter
MESAISREPDDRQSLSTFRSIGSTLAGVIVGAGIPLFAYETVNGQTILQGQTFTMIAGIFSILAIVCYFLCFFLTTERFVPPVVEKSPEERKISHLFKSALTNRALISITAGSILMLLAQLTLQSMANYIYPNYYGAPMAQSVSTVLMMVAMLLAAAVAKPLARLIGKAEISAIANSVAAVICLALFLIRPQNGWVYVLLNLISFFGLGIFTMVSWALITDVIDYSEIRNGVREDGSIYAIYSFARKLGQAASAGLSGGLLSLIGYNMDTAFDRGVLEKVFDISTLLPALGFIGLALILYFWYPLKKREVLRNVQLLKEKHGDMQ